MKVYISNYRHHWYSPYKILEYTFFWTDWSRCGRWNLTQTLEDEQREKSQWVDHPEWVDRWADRIEPMSRVIQWVLDKIHPPVNYVKIDRWDTWSMDSTLSNIILPMLRQLRETKHGAPNTDDADVPEYLRSHMAQPKEHEWDTDSLHFMRWDWILDEMIYAFEKKNQDDWASEFHSGEIDWEWVPVDKEGNEVAKGEHRYYEMKHGPNHTHKLDMAGMEAVQKRITNGFRLFGKYYEALWD
jgi:hypothetical protein